MAVRATDEDVEGIIEIDASISLTPFILIANELVTELCSDSSYSESRLTLIETWLAAHFYQIRDQAVSSESAKGVAVTYQHQIGLGLKQTKYGQTAMILDTAGNLSQLDKRMEEGEPASVSFSWLGTDYDTEDEE